MANVVGGTVVWNLDADISRLKSGLDKASASVKSTASSIDKNLGSVTKSITNSLDNAAHSSRVFAAGMVGVGGAIAGAIGYGAKIAGDLESARQGFVALLGSANKADDTMARIKREAAATPFELTGLITGAQALTAITKDGNQAIDVLLDVGKAIATSGKGQAELDRVILNLQQISSTGKVTAMDIRQFQSAIPMFNDIIKASGLTIEGLQNSSTAAEDLFGAFKKAGMEGGLTAAGFSAQAGTFNQLISNMKDNITILSAEIVNKTGIFSGLKNAIAGINSALSDTDGIIKIVNNAVGLIGDNATVLAGAIIGALTPALYGATTAAIGLITSLLPFILIGAAVGLLVKMLVDQMGGWEATTKKVKEIWDLLAKAFNTFIRPALSELVNIIKNELLPELSELWKMAGPILTPVFKLLGAVVGGTVLVAFRAIIGWLTQTISWVSAVIGKFNDLINFFKSMPEAIRKSVDAIKSQLDRINPFHRESPSLVDNVKAGVGIIANELKSLTSFNGLSLAMPSASAPATAFTNPGGGFGQSNQGNTINITVNAQVGNEMDVDTLVERLQWAISKQGLI